MAANNPIVEQPYFPTKRDDHLARFSVMKMEISVDVYAKGELALIRKYIESNPRHWAENDENPMSGKDNARE